MFIVVLDHNGETWPLRGTVWAYSMDRAQQFATREAAQAQLDKAAKFMKKAQFKKARIVEVREPGDDGSVECILASWRKLGEGK